ncbi:MAG TPA: glycosyl hydrolase [Bryobacteraceae bacterium]|nr:glycosyl hydrolase [Bryobacteraceae bacterium]
MNLFALRSRTLPLFLLVTILLAWPVAIRSQEQPNAVTIDYSVFKEAPPQYGGVRWISFNLSNISEESVIASVKRAAESGSAGSFEIGPTRGPTTGLSEAYIRDSRRKPDDKGVPYLSDEYFKLYKLAIEEGQKDHFPLSVLYDEWNYPTGMVGGQIYSQHPELVAKSLEMVEKDVNGPAEVELSFPNGYPYIGAVRMNMETHQCVDISSAKKGSNAVATRVPKGKWKVMVYYLDPTFRPASSKGGFIDYLDPKAVDMFISMSYQKYYDHFKEYFGDPIRMSFYDEPAMHLNHGRMWTAGFNQAFEKKYGYSPMKYYPALWYDIGPDTAAARNALFGFHADLYATNFIGRLAQWGEEHHLPLTGHQDQEEARNPVAIHGDLMKVFEHQQIPAIDDIYYPGRSNVSYKVVTSAAFNYDRPITVAETYAAYRKMDRHIAYRTAMDQYAMGVNMQVNGPPASMGPEMERYISRLSYMLQHGRHVADIAVLYPIAALQAAYYFATPNGSDRGGGDQPTFVYALEGGIVPPEMDYMDLGEMLYRGLRRDYTYLHPEVLAERCTPEKQELVLNNKENREAFRVLIIPGGDTISAAAANKILAFYRGGGTVIATRKLPSLSAEFGRNQEVRQAMDEIFGVPKDEPMTAEIRARIDDYKTYFFKKNDAGGRGIFIPQPDPNLMEAVLKEVDAVPDVDIQQPIMWPVKMGTAYDGALTYIHKVKDGRDIYFFANSTEKPVDTKVVLRGKKNLTIWDPLTGEKSPAELTAAADTTTIHLVLPPVTSLFYVQN